MLDNCQILLAFCGTSDVNDWITDLRANLVPLKGEQEPAGRALAGP